MLVILVYWHSAIAVKDGRVKRVQVTCSTTGNHLRDRY